MRLVLLRLKKYILWFSWANVGNVTEGFGWWGYVPKQRLQVVQRLRRWPRISWERKAPQTRPSTSTDESYFKKIKDSVLEKRCLTISHFVNQNLSISLKKTVTLKFVRRLFLTTSWSWNALLRELELGSMHTIPKAAQKSNQGDVNGFLCLLGCCTLCIPSIGSNCQQRTLFECLREAIRKKRPELWTDKSWFLHYDNQSSPTSLVLRDHFASCDFWLFPKLKSSLRECGFDSIEGI